MLIFYDTGSAQLEGSHDKNRADDSDKLPSLLLLLANSQFKIFWSSG